MQLGNEIIELTEYLTPISFLANSYEGISEYSG
jgi:hypothetical protein